MRNIAKLLLVLLLGLPMMAHAQLEAFLGYAPVLHYNRIVLATTSDLQHVILANVVQGGGYTMTLVNAEGETVLELGRSLSARFLDDKTLLHQSAVTTQYPRIYNLEDLSYRSMNTQYLSFGFEWVNEGQDYVFAPTWQQEIFYYQPPDYSEKEIAIANRLAAQYYSPSFLVMPDKKGVLVAGQNNIQYFDIETREVTKRLPYPVATRMTISQDGKYLSFISNGNNTSVVGTWRIIDLETEEQVFEQYGANGVHGMVSHDGKYAAGVIGTSLRGGIGNLTVYKLPSMDVVHKVDRIQYYVWFGNFPSGHQFGFAGEMLAYLREPQELFFGKVTLFNPHTVETVETPYVGRLSPWVMHQPNVDTVRFSGQDTFDKIVTLAGELILNVPASDRAPLFLGDGVMALGQFVYADASKGLDSAPYLSARTNSSNINVRSAPDANATRIAGASGDVTVTACNFDCTWFYLAEYGGWTSAQLVRVEGDVTTLPKIRY